MSESKSGAARRKLPSLLPVWLKRFLVVCVGLAGFLLADTVYLLLVRLADGVGLAPFALGADSLPRLYQFMVLAHTGVGLVLVGVMAAFLVAHLPSVWVRYHRASAVSGITYGVLGVLLTVTGLLILSAQATIENRWAWWAHVISAAAVVGAYVAHRMVSYTRPEGIRFARYLGGVCAAALALFLVHGAVVLAGPGPMSEVADAPGAAGRDVPSRMEGAFGPSGWVPVGAVPPESPFFPSAATTSTGGYLDPAFLIAPGFGTQESVVRAEVAAQGFASETRIGAESCEACHQDVTDQWATSAHRFASFNNPFYEATTNDMRLTSNESNPWVDAHLEAFEGQVVGVGRAKSKWCSGCHDPALMLTGDMDRDIDRASPQAQAGLTCMACHAVDRIHDRTGNGNYNIDDRIVDPYLFADAEPGSWQRYLHDVALKARPAVHQGQLLRPFYRESSYCGLCHKVGLTEPVNNYRWLRGQREFDNWDDSGVSLNAARTFYLPPAKRVCQDCHMPREPAPKGDLAAVGGTVRSHRFLAANTALPFVRGDTATVRRTEEFLQSERLRVDLFAVKTAGEGIAAPVNDEVTVPSGVPITLDVVVRNLGVGHTFPGGTNDSNEGWLELTLEDEEGRRVVASGLIGPDGHLDPLAHTFKAVLVDRDGNRIAKRNGQDIHVTVYANVIGPGTADIAHYEMTLPPEWEGRRLEASVRLLWRKFDRGYTEFAYEANPEGFQRFDDVPELPITEIASDRATLVVGDAATSPLGGEAESRDWMRFNDYAIGLLLEGDTRAAARAFTRVAELVPEQIDGPLNLARTALAEGNLDLAYEALERAEAVAPGNGRAAWVWGQAYQEDGLYAEAIEAYRRVLETFPGDRATWRALGRTYYLDLRFEEALEALGRVLTIDPEDRIAHYHRMLSLRALGRDEEAARAEAAYVYYGVDETAQEITRAYRARDEGANIMAQPVPTHRLEIRR